MEKTTNGTVTPLRPERPENGSASAGVSNVRAAFNPDSQGGGTIHLQYSGPLISYDPIWVRIGERRQGHDWLKTRDVMMEKGDGVATATIAVAPGDPVEEATFAFFTVVGRGGQEVWDNAGKPYGCYVLHLKTGQISAR